MIFLCMIAHRNNTVAHTLIPSFDIANGGLYIVFVDIQKFCCHGNET